MSNKKRKAQEFEKTFRELEHRAYRLCLYYTKDELVAEELTQQAMFNLYLKYEDVDKDHMEAYIARTIRNMSFTWLKYFKKLRDGQLQDITEECAKIISVEDECVRELEMKLALDLSESLLTALYAKNPDWYDLVMMAYYFDMPQGDIANELGVDRYAVSSKLYRAKKWIRQNYREGYEKYKRDVEG